jgi:DNA-directed RNA polymerase III subunit RPC11
VVDGVHQVSRSPETGTNRLECRTCPYQFILTRKYYERKPMKRKEVDDVMGGEGAWDNVDQTEGISPFKQAATPITWTPKS